MDYKQTLNLPRTPFPMKGNLPVKEKQILQFWNEINAYEKLLAARADAPSFILHDGPPYANGHIHLQTALSSQKDYLWIDQAVELLIKISAGGKHRLYNVAAGRQISHSQWVDAIRVHLSCAVTTEPGAPEISYPPIQVNRIRDEFGPIASDALAHVGEILAAGGTGRPNIEQS